jgi:hypothetical protein
MPFGSMFGVMAIIWAPIMYGLIGFLGALVVAALYNWLSGIFGGVEVVIE